MSFLCPCLSWLRLDQGPLHVQQDDQPDSPNATSQIEKKSYKVVRLSGDADSEPVHFSVLGSNEESEKSSESCQSPLMNLILNTKNAITNKIQQGKEIATDSITTAYNNSAIMERFENFGDRIGTGLLPERNREAECVICLVEFSEGTSIASYAVLMTLHVVRLT